MFYLLSLFWISLKFSFVTSVFKEISRGLWRMLAVWLPSKCGILWGHLDSGGVVLGDLWGFLALCLLVYLQALVYVLACWITSSSLQPCGWEPARLLCPWDSPGKSTGVGCHFLLQGIFPTQGSNLHLLHGRKTLPADLSGKPSSCVQKGNFQRFLKNRKKKKRKKTHWKLIFSWDGMGTILWISCFAVKGNCFGHIFTIGMIRSHDYWGICFAL